MDSSNNKTSYLVKSEVPGFVRADHPMFIRFMEAYYEYLEQHKKAIDVKNNILSYSDIDTTLDEFTIYLYNTFLKNFPKDILTDKDTILKYAKDIYRAKGTEKAIRFFMRAMFNEEIEFYYPKQDVLRASDGKWYIQRSLRVQDTYINGIQDETLIGLERYISRRVTGDQSHAFATVESVDRFFLQGSQVDELILSDIRGTFQDGETIRANTIINGITVPIQSNVFGGIINTVTLTNPGSQYKTTDEVIIVSSTGSGAQIRIAAVSQGNIGSITVINGGAGFQTNNNILITGGGGTGASAYVANVDTSGIIHPNSYNIAISTILLEANTPIGNTLYSNLNSLITDPANNSISNSQLYFTYSNTGPITGVEITSRGSGFQAPPSILAQANNKVKNLGILGRLEIQDGGSGYQVGDIIEFINHPLGSGYGANAVVYSVGSGNTITEVRFSETPGWITGGAGYNQTYLPTANVISNTGTGAIILAKNLLGYGDTYLVANTTLGAIERLIITSAGSNYGPNTTIDLTQSGDGTATAEVTTIQGVITSSGRYLNDDGHLSSYNFLQDRDYYQNYSYVIRIRESINHYRTTLKSLAHPAGLKVFGQYTYINDEDSGMMPPCDAGNVEVTLLTQTTYTKTNTSIEISWDNTTNISANDLVALDILSGNATSNIYSISSKTSNTFLVVDSVSGNTSGNVLVNLNIS